MNEISDGVRRVFDHYEKAVNATDTEIFSSLYADTFMFGGPHGVQSVKKEDFLKVIPKRKGFFVSVGLRTTKLETLEETRLDDKYILVRAIWKMRFEKDPGKPIDDANSATYILSLENNALRIVFQIDHQDLTKKAQELGLV